jgi:hypothetical protein
LLIFGQRTAERVFFLFDRREDLVVELADDVVLLFAGEHPLHGLEIAIDEFHGVSPVERLRWRARSIRVRDRFAIAEELP